MSEGFKKGKIPERFEGKTDEQLDVMQHNMWNYGKTVVEKIDGKITAHLTHYFDYELAAVQIIRKIERLEKALDKACEVLENIDNRSAYFESLHSGRKEESMTAEEWKEWCMNDD